jgi:hypothetical protein
VFEPTHGSAPKYAGQYKVNPIAMLLTAKLMLDWLKETEMRFPLATDRGQATVLSAWIIRRGEDFPRTRNLFYCVAMTNDIRMHDLVALTEDVAAKHFITHQPLQLRRGQVGTIVMPLNGNHFQVEFSDREGRAYAMLPLNSKQLMILREQPEATAA